MYALSLDSFMVVYAAVVGVCSVVAAIGAVFFLRALLEALDPEVEQGAVQPELPRSRMKHAA